MQSISKSSLAEFLQDVSVVEFSPLVFQLTWAGYAYQRRFAQYERWDTKSILALLNSLKTEMLKRNATLYSHLSIGRRRKKRRQNTVHLHPSKHPLEFQSQPTINFHSDENRRQSSDETRIQVKSKLPNRHSAQVGDTSGSIRAGTNVKLSCSCPGLSACRWACSLLVLQNILDIAS